MIVPFAATNLLVYPGRLTREAWHGRSWLYSGQADLHGVHAQAAHWARASTAAQIRPNASWRFVPK